MTKNSLGLSEVLRAGGACSKGTDRLEQHGQAMLAVSCDERKGGEETLHIG